MDLGPYSDVIRRLGVGVHAGRYTLLSVSCGSRRRGGGGEEADVVCRTEGLPGATHVSPHKSQD